MSRKNVMRRLLPGAIVLVTLVAVVVLIRTRPEPRRRPPQANTPLVQVHDVTGNVERVEIRASGTVEPKRSIQLVPQVGGKVTDARGLDAGAFFARGDVLVRIDPADYELALQQARAQVAQAEYALATAEEEAELARQEWERTRDDALPDSGLKTAEPNPLVYRLPQLRQAEAGREAARAALAQAELDLDRCTVAAPFDGRVVSENVDLGQYVRPGEVLATISAIDVAEITVMVPDRDLAWIDVAQAPGDTTGGAPVRVRGEFAGETHDWEGRAVRLGGAVDRTSRLVPVVVEVKDPYARHDGRPPLVEGMFVDVVFHGDAPAGAVTIPRAALRPGDEVWLVAAGEGAQATLRQRRVQVARKGIDRVVVRSGLAPGDRVITSDLQTVVEGMPVRVRDADDDGAVAATAGEAR